MCAAQTAMGAMGPPPSSAATAREGDDSSPPSPASSATALPLPPPPTSPSQQQKPALLRERPAVPPKPQLDIVRFSMAQAKDEVDLDTILSELLELETQLSGEAGDRLLLGLPALPSQSQKPSFNGDNLPPKPIIQQQQQPADNHSAVCAAPVEQMAKRVQFRSVHAFDQADCAVSSVRLPPSAANSEQLCASPDTDSAFGDSSSTESAHQPHIPPQKAQQHHYSSAESFPGSLDTPSPTHQRISSPSPNATSSARSATQNGGGIVPHHHQRPPSSAASCCSALASDEQKAQKIREALEKMKEAKMKKVFVKIFLEDGSQRGLLIDERWTVAEAMRQLADKIGVPLTPEHAILEEYPHLRIKRVYEDHELVVENLEDWTADSPNKLHFVRLPHKWAVFRQPQHFLLTERNRNEFPAADEAAEWSAEQQQRLVDSYLREDAGLRVPELEGWLLLKADGKKSWRRHFFVLRSSGLYYVAKPGKPRGPTRDLHCLMSVFNNQVYTCVDWQKKYRAPTDFGFAIKHPRIQLKTSKYIKYVCAEDEHTFRQWLTALRITKNGCGTLHKNYCAAQSRWRPAAAAGPSTPIRVEVPQVPLQRLSAIDPSLLAFSSPRHSALRQQQQTHLGGSASPGTMRSAYSSSSRASLDNADSSPVCSGQHIAFDQDECCNTIKRQPDSVALGQLFQQRRAQQMLATPTTSNGVVCPPAAEAPESDSDEEQFPPPPPMEQANLRANECLQQSSATRNGPPPPPPKRALGTRLQTAAGPRGAQMDLMAELQMRQKMRMGQQS